MFFGKQNNVLTYNEEKLDSNTISGLISGVYLWMFLALLLTAIVSFVTFASGFILILASNALLFYGLFILEIALVIYISARYSKMSFFAIVATFLFYSAVNGITLSFVFAVYTGASILLSFLITAGTFGIMSIYGYFTKADLTTFGNLLLMGLLGLILATVVNLFLGSETLDYILSWGGVLIFTGLVAYDTNKIKLLLSDNIGNADVIKRVSIMGALALYLDFINLFLYILRLFGSRKN